MDPQEVMWTSTTYEEDSTPSELPIEEIEEADSEEGEEEEEDSEEDE